MSDRERTVKPLLVVRVCRIYIHVLYGIEACIARKVGDVGRSLYFTGRGNFAFDIRHVEVAFHRAACRNRAELGIRNVNISRSAVYFGNVVERDIRAVIYVFDFHGIESTRRLNFGNCAVFLLGNVRNVYVESAAFNLEHVTVKMEVAV